MKNDRHKAWLATFVASAAVVPAWGQGNAPATTPAARPPAETGAAKGVAEADTGEVLVVAERGATVAIDRKSYLVKQGPAAEIADGMDVMRDLPSVSVTAAGGIELLGNANVKILIDGRPVPDAQSVLRAMNAAQILKVEVITNPSAQFPADGTAGIINVITKRASRDGLGGTVSAGVDSRGSVMARAAPTWTQGKWTLSTSPTVFRQRAENGYELERRRIDGVADGVNNRDETGESKIRGRGFFQRSQLVYRPDQKRSLSASLTAGTFRNDMDGTARIAASDGSFAPFSRISDNGSRFRFGNFSTDYRAEGTKSGQLLTVAGTWTRFTNNSEGRIREVSDLNGIARDLTTETAMRNSQAQLKADYTTPVGTTRLLSVGASVDWARNVMIDRRIGGGLIGPSLASFSDFRGDYRELAAYVTYQVKLGDWKLLPGLRVQSRDYSLDDLNGGGPSRTDLFPSLFVERKLSKTWTSTVSYSRRIAWAGLNDLSPQLRYGSSTFAWLGNPNLKPEFTDAFEARVSRTGKVHSFDLTAYHRVTHDTFDRAITLRPDGVQVSSPINAGRRLDQGVEAGFRGRLIPSLRYNLTGNLTAVTRNVGTIGNRQRNAQYRGKLQLDYTQGKQADPGYDQVTFNLRYEGPRRDFQTRTGDYVDADLSWTHRFTPKLALVSSVFGLLGGIDTVNTTRTPFLYERARNEGLGRTFRLNLIYQLGNKPQPLPPQAPGAPGIPGVGG